MKNKPTVEFTLLVSNKPGVLSSLVVKGGSVGLAYRSQQAKKINPDRSRMVISFDGEISCNKQDSITTFEDLPEVIKVEKIIVTNPNQISVSKNQS